MPLERWWRRRTGSWTGCWAEAGASGRRRLDPAVVDPRRSRPLLRSAASVGGRQRRVRARGHPPTDRGAWPHHHRGLRGAGARPDLGPQRRLGVPRRPDPFDRAPGRDRLHVHLPVRGRRRIPRPGAHREGPRPGHRRARRDRGRGHRRHGAHALVPRLRPRVPRACLGRGLRAARQERASDRAARDRVPRLRVSRRVRRRRRSRLRGAIPQPARHPRGPRPRRRSARNPTCCCRTSRAGRGPAGG